MSSQGIDSTKQKILLIYLLVNLGLAHYFKEEIDGTLEEGFEKIEEMVAGEEDLKRVRLDPNVTLARASDHAFDAYVPTGVSLVGRSDRQPSGASSSEIELPTFRPEVAPPMETEPFSPRPALGDSTEGKSSYANPESSSRGSDDSGRVDTDEGTSGAGKRSLVNFRITEPKSPGPGLGHGIRLDDTNDVASTMTVRLFNALKPAGGWEGISILYPQANDRPWSPPPGYMCVYESFIKNGGLCFPVPRLLLQYCHRRRIALSQLTHGSMRTMMDVVVFAAEYGGVVNLDEFEEISSFSSMGNTGRFYVSPRVEPVKRKTPKDSIITLLRKKKSHIRQWPDFLSYLIARSYPRFSSGDFYLPLEDNSPDIPPSSNKKSSSNRKQKGSTPAKRKNVPAQSRPKKSLREGGKHISQVPLACLQFVCCVRGGLDFLSPPPVDSSSSDPDTQFAMSAMAMLAGYNFLSDARYDLDQKNRKLNTQNGNLVAESSRSKEARTKAESEVVKVKDLLSHSHQMNGELIASRDELSSKVAALTLALAKAEEAKKDEVSRIEGEVAELRRSSKVVVARAVEEVRRKAKDKLRRSIEIIEGRSRAQTKVDRLASLACQVTGAIRRMEKAVKDGVPIDAAKKEKLEARLASYIAAADSIVLPSLPTDTSGGEEIEPKKSVALDISSSDSPDDEAERIEADGRMSVAGKTPALTLAKIEVANIEAEHANRLTVEFFGEEVEGDVDVAETEGRIADGEHAAIEELVGVEGPAIDAATGEPIAPLFPDLNPEEAVP
ncbi:hypothetical protein AALP_AA7G194700 [Arabis alpina]|uniref:Uncharacterized protein n=1 Tax=Arabis alpina TaxID=50452 RepID=A0A087GJ61_ARAAL|nr:hypothetical protein AALP_AA7G194700 [Arabis alpina]